jgi:tRNA(fMet)-specific endonuclease VapC
MISASYLLDTDTLIFLYKQNAGVTANVQQLGTASIAISVITIAEVLHGAYFSAKPQETLQATRSLIAQFAVLDLTTPIAERFGLLKADFRRLGQVIADFDLLIAATALIANRVLVTNNIKHFQQLSPFGLILENWKT